MNGIYVRREWGNIFIKLVHTISMSDSAERMTSSVSFHSISSSSSSHSLLFLMSAEPLCWGVELEEELGDAGLGGGGGGGDGGERGDGEGCRGCGGGVCEWLWTLVEIVFLGVDVIIGVGFLTEETLGCCTISMDSSFRDADLKTGPWGALASLLSCLISLTVCLARLKNK